MQSESWQSCTELFNATIERPHNARKVFLDRACHGDESLRRKVELLLKYHDTSGDFIEAPAFAVAPELLADDPEALIGQYITCYRVDAVAGSGGMGVVYRAYDKRLERKVALKLLPRSFAADETQLERVQREARTASALNHPNIVTIHEIGSVDSIHFIATEFIEGITLRQRISAGPIPPREALEIATQIASALRVAHAAGVVHRDIKPENIILRPDGIVKVLDFGIAKLIEQPTRNGEVIGTTRYMSPEQERGEALDARSDLWSYGVVFAEMLGGARPATMQRIIERCLREDAADRYQSAEEVRAGLRVISEKMKGATARRAQWLSIAATALLLLTGGGLFYVWRPGKTHPAPTPTSEVNVALRKPTQNPDAYVLYLRGRELEIANESSSNLIPATKLYQHAIDLDPSFALARARLSICASRIVDMGLGGDWRTRARAEAEEALRVQPRLGEARLALSHCYLWVERDYQRALAEVKRAAELLPNSPEVPVTAAYIYKRLNKYQERLAALQRAETLDPRNLRALELLTTTLRNVRDWREAMQSFDRYDAIVPREKLCSSRWRRARDQFQFSGDIQVLKNAIARWPDTQTALNRETLQVARYETAVFEHDYAEAAQWLRTMGPQMFGRQEGIIGHSKPFHQGLIAVAMDLPTKQQALATARDFAEARLTRENGETDEHALAEIALIDAFLGRKETAVEEALRSVELRSKTDWFIERNNLSSALAMVYAHTGEPEKAIDLIEHLLTVTGELQCGEVWNMTVTDLKYRWEWDPLRSHPRFQRIIGGAEPKTVY